MTEMRAQCVSIRGREFPDQQCPCRPLAGSEWCGKHKAGRTRYAAPEAPTTTNATAGQRIFRAWRRWLARRAGPLLWCRNESNNPADFFSGDPVEDLPLGDVISFVDGSGKGYIMDIKSAKSLLEHAAAHGDTPLNPFNRAPLPALFLARAKRHLGGASWQALQPQTEEQRMTLACTDMFRLIEDLGYYTDPTWLLSLNRLELQRLYMELADIWNHRAMLSHADRARIAPGQPFGISVQGSLVMPSRALRLLLIETCRRLVSSAASRSDRQTGVMYVLGALSLVSGGCAAAYPWLVEMFAPGVVRIVGNQLAVLHAAVLTY